jgi:hypothetical protein
MDFGALEGSVGCTDYRLANRNEQLRSASYGGQFEQLIEGEGFLLDRMSPQLTLKQSAHTLVFVT